MQVDLNDFSCNSLWSWWFYSYAGNGNCGDLGVGSANDAGNGIVKITRISGREKKLGIKIPLLVEGCLKTDFARAYSVFQYRAEDWDSSRVALRHGSMMNVLHAEGHIVRVGRNTAENDYGIAKGKICNIR